MTMDMEQERACAVAWTGLVRRLFLHFNDYA